QLLEHEEADLVEGEGNDDRWQEAEDQGAAADEEGVADDLPEFRGLPDVDVVLGADPLAAAKEPELLEARKNALDQRVVDKDGEVDDDREDHHVEPGMAPHLAKGAPCHARMSLWAAVPIVLHPVCEISIVDRYRDARQPVDTCLIGRTRTHGAGLFSQ